jgi:hypothetical protein
MQKAADLEQELKTAEGDSSILIKEVRLLKDTSKPVTELDLLKTAGKGMFGQSGKRYNTITEYDSVQHALPPDKRDGWFMHAMTKKQIQLNAKYKGDPNEVSTNFLEIFLHKLPYLLFISLPLFALTLALLYFRRRRQFFYTDHAVFSIHHYIFSFILLLCIFLLGAAKKTPGFHWLRVIEVILIFVWPIHLYIAMLNFYNQGWFKTFLKFFLLNIIALVSLLILFVGFLLLSIFQL